MARLERLQEDDEALISILGGPGTGKTRLAIELGHRRLANDACDAEVWFVDLSQATSAEDFEASLAKIFSNQAKDTSEETLDAQLRARGDALLILDNLEQCLEPARDYLHRWLDEFPRLRFLITSRRRSDIQGERCVELKPMASEAAIELFRYHSERAQPRWGMMDATGEIHSAIVALLDNIPLAIELAASRVRVMSPPELLDRLKRDFRVLRQRGVGVPERHATLDAAIRWSWNLLSKTERDVLKAASTFQSAFSLKALETLCGGDALDVLEGVESVNDHSLLNTSTENLQTRFQLLGSVRGFVRRQRSQDEISCYEQRHTLYFAERGEEWLEQIAQNQISKALSNIRCSFDDLLAVYHRCRESDPGAASRIAQVFEPLLSKTGGRQTFMSVLGFSMAGTHNHLAPERLHAHLLHQRARKHTRRGRTHDAMTDLEQAICLLDEDGASSLRWSILRALARVLVRQQRHDDATHHYQQAP